MRCLVTGGAGFVGSHTVDALIEAKHEVTILDNLCIGNTLNPEAEFIEADIISIGQCPPVDYVFHFAALPRIQPSIDNPIEYHRINLTGTLAVLEYCRKHNTKLIYAGSSSTFDEVPAKENSPQKATNPYTLQKLASEMYIKLYGELHSLDYAILRYFNVYGERQVLSGEYAALIGIFLEQKRNDQPLTIVGDGEQRRDFTYVKDVARANLMAMKWQGEFNIGTGINYSVNQIADFVGGDKLYLPKRQGEVKEVLADSYKAFSLGWYPTVNIAEWINAAN